MTRILIMVPLFTQQDLYADFEIEKSLLIIAANTYQMLTTECNDFYGLSHLNLLSTLFD